MEPIPKPRTPKTTWPLTALVSGGGRGAPAVCAAIVIGAAALVAGCATGPAFQTIEPPQAGHAAIYLYRTSSLFGTGIKHEVALNAATRGTMVNGGYMRFEVAPGEAMVRALGCEPPALAIAVASGEVGYVQLQLTNKTFELGGRYYFDYGCRLVQRNEADALAVLPSLRAVMN